MSTMPGNVVSPDTIAPPLPDAPYRGIAPFRFVDQQIFTAREDETWTLLSNITLYRAVLLYGASGTGKSSLVNAGLLPRALKENHVADRLRVQPFAGREIKVERIRMSGGEDPSAYLPSNFAPPESDASAESIELSLAQFRTRLEEFRPETDEGDSGTLFRVNTRPRPLLIFDQFEEFITLFEEAQRVSAIGGGARAQDQVPGAQQEILATLVDLIQDETLPVKIIFSFREDYLAKLSILFDYCPELLDQALRLLPPQIEALPQIIRAPFTDDALRAHFLKHGGNSGSELSEPLAREIGDELSRRSEGGVANLTELQIVCQRLWEAPDPESLFAKDGIVGLLKDYGADVFRNFTPELRDAAVVLLSHMVTASNTRNIISEDDLLSRTVECNFQPSQCADALGALASSQIVRREPRHSIYFYEITSEYLVPWIKERVAERKSAEERLLAEQNQQKLEAERAQAVEKFEAERRRSRVMTWLLAAMSLLLVAAIILGIIARVQHNRADALAKRAEAAEKQTEEILNTLKLVTSQNPQDNLKGIAQFDALVKEKKISQELASAAIQPALAKPEPVHRAAYEFLLRADPNLAQSVINAAKTNNALAQQIPARFYIHIADESQRNQAQQLTELLKKRGYLVPPVQNVGDKGVKRNQLRYFRDSDPGFPTPEEIVKLLAGAKLGAWVSNRVPGYENSTKVVPGQFELWLATPQSVSPAGEISPAAAATEAADLLKKLEESFLSSDEKEKAASLEKLQGIVAALEKDKEIAPLLKVAGVSSTMANGPRLLSKLRNLKRALPSESVLQNKINQAIVSQG